MSKYKNFVVIWVCFLISPSIPAIGDASAMGDAFSIGMKAFNLRDYTTAMARFYEEAQQDNRLAKEFVGQFYQDGHAAPKDGYEALYWFRQADISKDDKRIIELEKQGFTLPDTDLAILKLYLQQAANGDADAMYRLGKIYSYGRGVKQNLTVAFDWFLKAAQAGHAYAQYETASLRYGGRDVSKDMDIVMHWLKIAADNDVTLAKYYYADFLRTGQAGHKDLVAAEKYYTMAAEDGYGLAQFELILILVPKVKSSEERIELLKWVFLVTDYFETPEMQKKRAYYLTHIKNLSTDETIEATKRARAFVRRNG